MTVQINNRPAIELKNIDSDWDYAKNRPDNWPENPRLNSICFYPNAKDTLVVRQRTATGVTRIHWNVKDKEDPKERYFYGARCVPFIPIAECVLDPGSKVVIELWREE